VDRAAARQPGYVLGRVSPGDPLFESFPGTATTARASIPADRKRPRRAGPAAIADGETTLCPFQKKLAAPSLGDISPDGSRLLLRNHLATAAEQGALDRFDHRGGRRRRIPGIFAHDATWMPDGQRILYATGDDLYIARDNGTESRKFATLPGRAFWLRWSPDGARLRLTLLNSETHTSTLVAGG